MRKTAWTGSPRQVSLKRFLHSSSLLPASCSSLTHCSCLGVIALALTNAVLCHFYLYNLVYMSFKSLLYLGQPHKSLFFLTFCAKFTDLMQQHSEGILSVWAVFYFFLQFVSALLSPNSDLRGISKILPATRSLNVTQKSTWQIFINKKNTPVYRGLLLLKK